MNVIADKFGTRSCQGMWGTFDNYQVLGLLNVWFCGFLCPLIACHYSSVCLFCSPHTVHRAHAGESERILREAFSEASSHATSGKPSVIFIDEIDALCPRRDSKYGTIDGFYAEYFCGLL